MPNQGSEAITGIAISPGGSTPIGVPVLRGPIVADSRRPVDSDNDIREACARSLPKAVQPFLTWLMAKPSDAEPYVARTPAYHVATAIIVLALGLAASILPFVANGWWWPILPVGLLLTTSALGKLQAVIYHHCAHDTVFRCAPVNGWVGEMISILLVIKRFAAYRRDHLRHHRAKVLLSDEDEFMEFVQGRMKMRRGMPKRDLWRRVFVGVASPWFHLAFWRGRLEACFLSENKTLNVVGATFWLGVIGAIGHFGLWWEFAVIWLVPQIVLFQIATMFRILCEHRFPDPALIERRDAKFICESTAGVVAGEPLPRPRDGRSMVPVWIGWWARLLTIHLFCRIFVLVGDAPAHDFHHRNQFSRKWASYIHARHKEARERSSDFPSNYIEYWGLFRAIDDVLETMSRTPETAR